MNEVAVLTFDGGLIHFFLLVVVQLYVCECVSPGTHKAVYSKALSTLLAS